MTTKIRMTALYIAALLAAAVALLAGAPEAAAQQGGGGYGPWGPIITFLRTFLVAAGSLGIMVGVAMRVFNPTDAANVANANTMIGGAITGLAIGFLAEPFYNLFTSWF